MAVVPTICALVDIIASLLPVSSVAGLAGTGEAANCVGAGGKRRMAVVSSSGAFFDVLATNSIPSVASLAGTGEATNRVFAVGQ